MPSTQSRTRRGGRAAPALEKGSDDAGFETNIQSLASTRVPRNSGSSASSDSIGGPSSQAENFTFTNSRLTARYSRGPLSDTLIIAGLLPEDWTSLKIDVSQSTSISGPDAHERALKRRKLEHSSPASEQSLHNGANHAASEQDGSPVSSEDHDDEDHEEAEGNSGGKAEDLDFKPTSTGSTNRGRGARTARGSRGGRGRGGRTRTREGRSAISDQQDISQNMTAHLNSGEQIIPSAQGISAPSQSITQAGREPSDTTKVRDDGSKSVDGPRIGHKIRENDESDRQDEELEDGITVAGDELPHQEPDFVEDVLEDEDLPPAFASETVPLARKDCLDEADFLLQTRFLPMTETHALIKALSRIPPSKRSTENLYAITLNIQKILKAWQDEFITLDRRTAPHQNPAKRPCTGGRGLIDPALFEDLKQAELYGYTYDAKKGPGNQNPWVQRLSADRGRGRELRARRARDFGEQPSEDEDEALAPTGKVAENGGSGIAAAVGRRKRKAVSRYDGMPETKRQRGAATPDVEGPRKKRGRPSAAERAAAQTGATLAIPPRIREMREESVTTISTEDDPYGDSIRDSASPGASRRRGRPPGSRNGAPRADKGVKKAQRASRSPMPGMSVERLSATPQPATRPDLPLNYAEYDRSKENLNVLQNSAPNMITEDKYQAMLADAYRQEAESNARLQAGPTGAHTDAMANDSKRRQRVKSEKRSQSMTLWWASRKAAQEEKRRKEAEDQRQHARVQQRDMERQAEQQRQLHEQQRQLHEQQLQSQQRFNYATANGHAYAQTIPSQDPANSAAAAVQIRPGSQLSAQRHPEYDRAPVFPPRPPPSMQYQPLHESRQPAASVPPASAPRPTEAEKREFAKTLSLQTFEMAGLNVRHWEPGFGDGSGKVSIAGTAPNGRRESAASATSPANAEMTHHGRKESGQYILPSPTTKSFPYPAPPSSAQHEHALSHSGNSAIQSQSPVMSPPGTSPSTMGGIKGGIAFFAPQPKPKILGKNAPLAPRPTGPPGPLLSTSLSSLPPARPPLFADGHLQGSNVNIAPAPPGGAPPAFVSNTPLQTNLSPVGPAISSKGPSVYSSSHHSSQNVPLPMAGSEGSARTSGTGHRKSNSLGPLMQRDEGSSSSYGGRLSLNPYASHDDKSHFGPLLPQREARSLALSHTAHNGSYKLPQPQLSTTSTAMGRSAADRAPYFASRQQLPQHLSQGSGQRYDPVHSSIYPRSQSSAQPFSTGLTANSSVALPTPADPSPAVSPDSRSYYNMPNAPGHTHSKSVDGRIPGT